MPRAQEKDKRPLLTREEWRARRELRREKQRRDNVKRAAKMHATRLKSEAGGEKFPAELKQSVLWDARAGVTGSGGIHFMKVCRRTTGSGTI